MYFMTIRSMSWRVDILALSNWLETPLLSTKSASFASMEWVFWVISATWAGPVIRDSQIFPVVGAVGAAGAGDDGQILPGQGGGGVLLVLPVVGDLHEPPQKSIFSCRKVAHSQLKWLPKQTTRLASRRTGRKRSISARFAGETTASALSLRACRYAPFVSAGSSRTRLRSRDSSALP